MPGAASAKRAESELRGAAGGWGRKGNPTEVRTVGIFLSIYYILFLLLLVVFFLLGGVFFFLLILLGLKSRLVELLWSLLEGTPLACFEGKPTGCLDGSSSCRGVCWGAGHLGWASLLGCCDQKRFKLFGSPIHGYKGTNKQNRVVGDVKSLLSWFRARGGGAAALPCTQSKLKSTSKGPFSKKQVVSFFALVTTFNLWGSERPLVKQRPTLPHPPPTAHPAWGPSP